MNQIKDADVGQDEEGNTTKYLEPVARINDIGRILIHDCKWFSNDLLLMITLESGEFIVMDPALYAYSLESQRVVGNYQKYMLTKGKLYTIKGYQLPQTMNGLSYQSQNPFLVLTPSKS
jgi:hypothetical protein